MTSTLVDMPALLRAMSPKQIRSIAYQPRAKISLWEGSVSAGKTLASLWAFLIAITRAPSNGLVVIIGKTVQTIHDNLFALLQSADLFGVLAGQVQYTRGAPAARILGREVLVIGANDSKAEGKIRGKTIGLAYVDEATLLPPGFWEMLVTRLRVPGACLLATTNPGPRNHWLRKDWILRARAVGMQVFSFVMADNPSLSAAYVASMESTFTGVFYDRFILGKWTNAEGAIFDMFSEDLFVVPHLTIPRLRSIPGAGIDVGSTHATAGGVLGWGDDDRLYITGEFWRKTAEGQLSSTYADISLGFREFLAAPHSPHLDQADMRPRWVFCDPAARAMKDQLYGDGVTNIANADNRVVDGIQTVRSLFSLDRLRISDRCRHLIDELPGYRWDPKAAEKGEDKPVKENDDAVDGALRYPIQSTRNMWARQLLGPAADIAA